MNDSLRTSNPAWAYESSVLENIGLFDEFCNDRKTKREKSTKKHMKFKILCSANDRLKIVLFRKRIIQFTINSFKILAQFRPNLATTTLWTFSY